MNVAIKLSLNKLSAQTLLELIPQELCVMSVVECWKLHDMSGMNGR